MPLAQSLTNSFLNSLKSFWLVSVHDHVIFYFILSFSFSMDFLVSCPRQKVAWFTRPRKPLMSLRLLGVGYFCIVSIWFWVGRTPCCVTCSTKILTSVLPTSNFLGLNMMLDCSQNVRYLAHCMKLCLNDVAHRRVSSMHLFQLGFVYCSFLSRRHLNTEFGFFASLSLSWFIMSL